MLGYYEWTADRRPYWFHAADGRMLFAAGLLSIWRGMPTCTILTRRAEGACALVHDRMPVIVPFSHAGVWLAPSADARAVLHDADVAGGGMIQTLDFHQVEPLHGDGPGLIRPAAPMEKQEALFD